MDSSGTKVDFSLLAKLESVSFSTLRQKPGMHRPTGASLSTQHGFCLKTTVTHVAKFQELCVYTTSPKHKQTAYNLNHWRSVHVGGVRNGSWSAVQGRNYCFNIDRYNECGLNCCPNRTDLSDVDKYERSFLESHIGHNRSLWVSILTNAPMSRMHTVCHVCCMWCVTQQN